MNKIEAAFESNPGLGWWGVIVSQFLGLIGWLINHAGLLGQCAGVLCAIFGAVASYYTMRIQKRRWGKESKRRRDYDDR